MNALLVIDDRKLRKDAFREIEKVLKKMGRLEAHLDAYHREDRRLYDDWYQTTFGEQRSKLDELQEKQRRLARFSNWIIALTELEKISMSEAVARVRAEEAVYLECDAETRENIDKARRFRDDYIEREIQREYEEAEARKKEARAEKLKAEARKNPVLEMFASYSHEQFVEICKRYQTASHIFFEALTCARDNADLEFILRIWEACSPRMQVRLVNEYDEETGGSLTNILGHIRSSLSQEAESQTQDEPDEDEVAEVAPERSPAEVHELLKLTYRKLVRLLHPDLQTSTDHVSPERMKWMKKTWLQVQTAYETENLPMLEKLITVVQIHSRNLNDLSISEIRESAEVFAADLKALEASLKTYRSQLSWGFSRKKDFNGVKNKIDKKLEAERSKTQKQIDELNAQHDYLARVRKINVQL